MSKLDNEAGRIRVFESAACGHAAGGHSVGGELKGAFGFDATGEFAFGIGGFADGFGGITDLEVGPDGYLYVLSLGLGTLFKIVPK